MQSPNGQSGRERFCGDIASLPAPIVNQPAAQTVGEFCTSNRISRATFYNLLKAGLGPRIMKAGNRTLISIEAGADWRRAMEQRAIDTAASTLVSRDAPAAQ